MSGLRKKEEEHGKREVRNERAMKSLRDNLEATIESEQSRVHMLESKWNDEHERLKVSMKRVEDCDMIIASKQIENEGTSSSSYFYQQTFDNIPIFYNIALKNPRFTGACHHR